MLHPQQFEVNEAWIAFRLNGAPVRTERDGDFNCIALMDAASCFILGSQFIPVTCLAGIVVHRPLIRQWAIDALEVPIRERISSVRRREAQRAHLDERALQSYARIAVATSAEGMQSRRDTPPSSMPRGGQHSSSRST